MSADKYPSIFSRQMEAIVYIYPTLAEQAVIIQLTSKSSHSRIAQEMFLDIWIGTELVVMIPSTVNLSCC